MHVFMLSIQIPILIPVCMFVCLINEQFSCTVLGTVPGMFPATSINLLLGAVIVNLTKAMISPSVCGQVK